MDLMPLLIHILVLVLILWLVFSYLLPLITEPAIRTVVTVVVVIIAILSLLHYVPGWRFY